jgi:hypothetical protein
MRVPTEQAALEITLYEVSSHLSTRTHHNVLIEAAKMLAGKAGCVAALRS